MEITTPRILPRFLNYIRNVSIEVSFDATSLYTNIPIIYMLNIIKGYVNNYDQFTRKTAVPQDKFLDLVNLVSTTTLYTFNSQFYQQTDCVAMKSSTSSTTAEIICRLMNVLQYLCYCTL